jgi:catechol 2,3-dioxygenase-like lactoylglutathione lyase family enzyme
MEFLTSRVLIRPSDPDRSRRFYADELGLAVYREFPGGIVFFIGQGLLELSGRGSTAPGPDVAIWLQVRDLTATATQVRAKGIPIVREPRREPWGLDEMWIADPDGLRIVIVQIPVDHPLRSDPR